MIAFSSNFGEDAGIGFDGSTTVAYGGQYNDGTSMSDGFVILNAQNFDWTTDAITAESNSRIDDVESVILHELGHVVGLDHSSDSSSIMASPRLRTVQREISDDDRNAIGHMYPEGGTAGCAMGSISNSQSGPGGGATTGFMMVSLCGWIAIWMRRRRASERHLGRSAA
jgi:hypothetical protein